MNKNTVQGNWEELKGKVRQTWGKLTDDDVERVKGNWQELSGKVQKAYGYSKEKAWEEIESFKTKHANTADKKIENIKKA
jgi:uncharacterized protein YjbJ (UPF0337 family)